MVKNYINSTLLRVGRGDPFVLFQEHQGRVEVTIPKLNEMATEQVELASVPFITFIANKKQSGEPASIRSCCGVMSAIGSAMCGPSTIASLSPS